MKPAKYPLNVARRRLSGGLRRLPKPAQLPQLARMPFFPAMSEMPSLPQPTRLSIAVYGALAALALGAVTSQSSAWAQESSGNVDASPMGLKPDAGLRETLPVEVKDALPTFVRSQSMENKSKTRSEFEGEVEVRRHDLVIRADKVEFDQQSSDLKATGNVLINRNGDRFTGPELQINVDTSKGYFEKPEYELLKNGGTGNASRVDFIDRDNMVVEDGQYSTCERVPGSKWMPAWLIRASSIELDTQEDVGTAKGGVLEFQGVPILAAPYLTFPLSDQRKSGALPPSMSIDSDSGVELAAPYYFNIAPNMDATLTPRLMTKRGLDLGGEFRYLEPSYAGIFRGAFMPSDRLRDEDRWAVSLKHQQTLVPNFAGGSGIGLRMQINRVGDNNYWSDFPRSITSLTSRLLPTDVTLGWAKGPWSVGAGAYKWQALQVEGSTFTPPYDRLPVLGVNYQELNQTLWGSPGWDLSLQSNFTRFERSSLVAGSSVTLGGDRSLAVGRISKRVQASGWYVQPSAQLHATQYNTRDTTAGSHVSASRVVPTLSVDSGLTFERTAQILGSAYTQTLEPRAFVTWTPYRDQSNLPNYDSGARDFNLATMYAENAFNGNDRIADTRAATVGVSSRLISPDSGSEVARLSIAQRYYLTDQKVTLPGGTAVKQGFSDVLVSGRVQWDPLWSLDATVQYNLETNENARTTVGGRYTPGPYRVLSAAYRYQRNTSKYLDVGWQWPVSALWGSAPDSSPGRALGPNQWYSVGRINYSLPDRKVVDLVAGFEYDAGCWLGRVVLQRLQTSTTASSESILFQLEFSGFSRVGASSLQSLEANVPGYRYLREEVSPPSRFPQYD
jgi:LPS-assembly protein